MKANADLLTALGPIQELFNESTTFDPWWWPLEEGRSHGDWGLPEGDNRLHSLRGPSPARSSRYPSFCGSIGAESGAVMLISTRPSQGSYPSGSCTQLYNLLTDMEIQGCTHVTDLYKVRGPGPDSIKDRATTIDVWKLSLDCLKLELEALRPRAILLVPEARKWVSAWTNGGFGRWRWDLSDAQYRTLEEINQRAEEVLFWGGGSRKGRQEKLDRWRRAILAT